QEVSKKLEDITTQIENISQEKKLFLVQANSASSERTKNEKRLSTVAYEYERNRATIKEAEHYFDQLHQKEKTNEIEQKTFREKEIELKIKIDEENQNELRNKKSEITKEIDEINKINSGEITYKNFLTDRINKLIPIKGKIEIAIARFEENIKNYSEKIKENDSQIHKFLAKNQEIQSVIISSRSKINEIDTEISKMEAEKETIDNKFFKDTTETNISKRVIEN